MVYEGEEALSVLAEALPSEYGREQSERGLVGLTYTWKTHLGYISTELLDRNLAPYEDILLRSSNKGQLMAQAFQYLDKKKPSL